MAGIDFSKFSDNFKKLWEEAIKDNKVTLDEFAKFSPEDQKKLTELLAGNPDAIGDEIKIVQTEYKCGEDTLELYLGKPKEGYVNLTGNYKDEYPNAEIGLLKDGVLTLLDSNKKPIIDKNGNTVQFVLTEQENKFRLPLQIGAVRKETRQFMLDLLKQAYTQKLDEFNNHLLQSKPNFFKELAMQLHDWGSVAADKLTELGIVIDRSDTRWELRDKLIDKQAQISVLEKFIDDEESFNQYFKEYFYTDFDYNSAYDYLNACIDFNEADIKDKLQISEKSAKEFQPTFEKLTNTLFKSADDYMFNSENTGGLMDLAYNVALLHVSGLSAAIAKFSQTALKGGEEVVQKAITNTLGKEAAQTVAGKTVSQATGIVSSQVMGAELTSAAFQGTKVVEAAGTGNLTNPETIDALGQSAWGLFKFGYVGSAISGPLGMQVKGMTSRLLNSKPIIKQVLEHGITNKPIALTSVLKSLSEHSDAISSVLKFGTEFGINAGYMAVDEGISYEEAIKNLGQMDGVSKMVVALLGGKNTAFLTPQKVQEIKTELAGYKVNVRVYQNEKVYFVTDKQGKETLLATPEEVFMFITDKCATGVNDRVGRETVKTNATNVDKLSGDKSDATRLNNSPESHSKAEPQGVNRAGVNNAAEYESRNPISPLSVNYEFSNTNIVNELSEVLAPSNNFNGMKVSEPNPKLVEKLEKDLKNGYVLDKYPFNIAILNDGTYIEKSDDRYVVSLPEKDDLSVNILYDHLGRIIDKTTTKKDNNGMVTTIAQSYENGIPNSVVTHKKIGSSTIQTNESQNKSTKMLRYHSDEYIRTLIYSNDCQSFLKLPDGTKSYIEDGISTNDGKYIKHWNYVFEDGSVATKELYMENNQTYEIEITKDGKAYINGKEVTLEEAKAKSQYKNYGRPKTEQELIQEFESQSQVKVPDGYVLDKMTKQPVKVDVDKIKLNDNNGHIVLSDERGNTLAGVTYNERYSNNNTGEKELYFYSYISHVNGVGAGTKVLDALIAKSKELGLKLTAHADASCYTLSQTDKPHSNLKFYYQKGFRATDKTLDKIIQDCIDKDIDIPPMLNRAVAIEYVGIPYGNEAGTNLSAKADKGKVAKVNSANESHPNDKLTETKNTTLITNKPTKKLAIPAENDEVFFEADFEEDKLKLQKSKQEYEELIITVQDEKLKKLIIDDIEHFIKINAPEIIMQSKYKSAVHYIKTINRIKENVENIQDANVKAHLTSTIERILDVKNTPLFAKLANIESIINNITTKPSEKFLKFLEKNAPKLYKIFTQNRLALATAEMLAQTTKERNYYQYILALQSDLKKMDKATEIIEICNDNPKSEKANKLYEEYLENDVLATSPEIAERLKDMCRQINKDFGVKVFLPARVKEAGVALKLVYQELAAWKMHAQAAGEEAVLPPTLDFIQTHEIYYGGHEGTRSGAGQCDLITKSININGLTVHQVKYALRHELAHANDRQINERERSTAVEDVYDIDEYVEELLNAGVPQSMINYGLTYIDEALAVAAQGDFTKYSEEFKNLLVKQGLPKWVFNMSNTDAAKNIISNPAKRLLAELDIITKYKKENGLEDENFNGFDEFDDWLGDLFKQKKPQIPAETDSPILTEPVTEVKTELSDDRRGVTHITTRSGDRSGAVIQHKEQNSDTKTYKPLVAETPIMDELKSPTRTDIDSYSREGRIQISKEGKKEWTACLNALENIMNNYYGEGCLDNVVIPKDFYKSVIYNKYTDAIKQTFILPDGTALGFNQIVGGYKPNDYYREVVMYDMSGKKYTLVLTGKEGVEKYDKMIYLLSRNNCLKVEASPEGVTAAQAQLKNGVSYDKLLFDSFDVNIDNKELSDSEFNQLKSQVEAKLANLSESVQELFDRDIQELTKENIQFVDKIISEPNVYQNLYSYSNILNNLQNIHQRNLFKFILENQSEIIKTTLGLPFNDIIKATQTKEDCELKIKLIQYALVNQKFGNSSHLERIVRTAKSFDDAISEFEFSDKYSISRENYEALTNDLGKEYVDKLLNNFEKVKEQFGFNTDELLFTITDNNIFAETKGLRKEHLQLYFDRTTGELLSVKTDNNIVYNLKDKTKTQTVTFEQNKGGTNKKRRLQSAVSGFYDFNGNFLNSVEYRKSKIPGQYEIYERDAQGREYKSGIAEFDKNSGRHIERQFKSLNNTVTDYVYADDKTGNRYLYYKVTDSDGKVLYESSKKFKVIDENHFVTTDDGQSFDIIYTDDNVTITKLDKNGNKTNEQVVYKIRDYSEQDYDYFKNMFNDRKYVEIFEQYGCKKAFEFLLQENAIDLHTIDRKLLPGLKHLSGSEWFDMNHIGTETLRLFNADNGHSFNGGIEIGPKLVSLTSVIEHEIGHEKFLFQDFQNDKEFLKIYNEEIALCKKFLSEAELKELRYFTIATKTSDPKDEAGAEVNQITNIPYFADREAGRNLYLMKYLPKTIAYVAKKNMEIRLKSSAEKELKNDNTNTKMSNNAFGEEADAILADTEKIDNIQPKTTEENSTASITEKNKKGLKAKSWEVKSEKLEAERQTRIVALKSMEFTTLTQKAEIIDKKIDSLDVNNISEVNALKELINDNSITEKERTYLNTLLENRLNPPTIDNYKPEQVAAEVYHLLHHFNNALTEIKEGVQNTGLTNLGKISQRLKSDTSTYDKLYNFMATKEKPTLMDALNDVRDAYGVRSVIDAADYTSMPEVQQILSALNTPRDISPKIVRQLKITAARKAAEYHSEELVESLKEQMIRQMQSPEGLTGVRMVNYCSKDGIPMLSESQLWDLKRFAQELGIPENHIELIYPKEYMETREVNPNEALIPDEVVYSDMGIGDGEFTSRAQKSGYTAFQMNFKTKSGDWLEFQCRDVYTDEFGEAEHLIYDTLTGKDIVGRYPAVKPLYDQLLEVLDESNMPKEVCKKYREEYLKDYYTYCRAKAENIDIEEPNLQEYAARFGRELGIKDLTLDPRLDAKNLMALHRIADAIKHEGMATGDGLKLYEQTIKEYEAKIKEKENTPLEPISYSKEELVNTLKTLNVPDDVIQKLDFDNANVRNTVGFLQSDIDMGITGDLPSDLPNILLKIDSLAQKEPIPDYIKYFSKENAYKLREVLDFDIEEHCNAIELTNYNLADLYNIGKYYLDKTGKRLSLKDINYNNIGEKTNFSEEQLDFAIKMEQAGLWEKYNMLSKVSSILDIQSCDDKLIQTIKDLKDKAQKANLSFDPEFDLYGDGVKRLKEIQEQNEVNPIDFNELSELLHNKSNVHIIGKLQPTVSIERLSFYNYIKNSGKTIPKDIFGTMLRAISSSSVYNDWGQAEFAKFLISKDLINDTENSQIYINLISHINPSNINLAKRLIMDKSFPRKNISEIITVIQHNEPAYVTNDAKVKADLHNPQLAPKVMLANKLCFDKSISCPTDIIQRILQQYVEGTDDIIIDYIKTGKVTQMPDLLSCRTDTWEGIVKRNLFERHLQYPKDVTIFGSGRTIPAYAKAKSDNIVDMHQKVLDDALANKNLLKSGLKDLTNEQVCQDLSRESVIKTIDLIGIGNTEAAFPLTLDDFVDFTEEIATMKLSESNKELLIEKINPQNSRKYQQLSTEIPALKKQLNQIVGADNLARIKAIQAQKLKIDEQIKQLKQSEDADTPTVKKQLKELQKQSKALGSQAQSIYFQSENSAQVKELMKQINSKQKEFNNLMAESATLEPQEVVTKLRVLSALSKVVKNDEMTDFIKMIKPSTPENDAVWSEAVNRKIFEKLEVEYDEALSKKLDFIHCKYISKIFVSDEDFFDNMRILVEVIKNNPELTIAQAIDKMPQNLETKRIFKELGFDYEKWTKIDKNSYSTVKIQLDAEAAKQASIKNLEEDLNDELFKSLPKDATEPIFIALREQLGVTFVKSQKDIWEGNGFSAGSSEYYRLFKDGKPIIFSDMSKIVSVIKKEINKNDFWTTKHSDAAIEQARGTMYTHLMDMRTKEVSNAKNLKEGEIVDIEVRKTDMYDIKKALGLGNDAQCCTAVGGGCNQWSAPTYIMNKCIGAIELNDNGSFVGNTMIYLAYVDGKPALVLDNIELKTKYQFNDKIRDTFVEYAKKLCNEIGQPDLPIYAGPNRHKLTMDIFEKGEHEMEIIGNSGDQEVYVDYDADGHYVGRGEKNKIVMYKIR